MMYCQFKYIAIYIPSPLSFDEILKENVIRCK